MVKMDYFLRTLGDQEQKALEEEKVVQDLLAKVVKEFKPILFDGDNYAKEWHEEAERRGIPNLATSAEALPILKRNTALGLPWASSTACVSSADAVSPPASQDGVRT